MLIDHNNKWIYTAIPKTASKSISVAFGHTQHPAPAIYHATVRDIIAANPGVAPYTSWGIVRHPFSRLVSVYFDFTLKRGRWYSETVQLEKPLLSEFKDFHDFCLRLGDSPWKDDIFFKQQVEFLRIPDNMICGGQLVGKYEELTTSFHNICETLRVYPIPRLTHQNEGLYDKKWRSFYTNLNQVSAIRKLYETDLNTFGYDF